MWIFNRKNKFIPGILSKEPRDIRDYQLSEIQPDGVELPAIFDLRDKMTSIQRQNWGTCTSHSVDGVKEFLDKKQYSKEIKLSQKFIYINTKILSGLWSIQGDYLRNALKSVCQYGAPLEEAFPDIRRSSWKAYIKDRPSENAYKEAEKYKGKTYWSVGKTLEGFRQAIFQQEAPVPFSLMWYKSYRTPAPDGKLPFPDVQLGGHAISCAGWEKDKLWFRNSHDLTWGLNGYAYIPFNEFGKHDIWDAWILTDKEKPQAITGWVAEKYIKKAMKFQHGEIVKSTAEPTLRIRENPTTNAIILGSLNKGSEAEVIKDENNGISANGHKWWKIRTLV